MKKTNLYIFFKEGKCPNGLLHDKYMIKKINKDTYIIAGDIEISKEFEGTDYTIEEEKKYRRVD